MKTSRAPIAVVIDWLLMEPKKAIRIVVVYPGDVKPEREILTAVVAEVNHTLSSVHRPLILELGAWDTDSYPGFHLDGAQGLIDSVLDIAHSDIVIGIFWKRFGTPVKGAGSGVEHELVQAYESWQCSGPHFLDKKKALP